MEKLHDNLGTELVKGQRVVYNCQHGLVVGEIVDIVWVNNRYVSGTKLPRIHIKTITPEKYAGNLSKLEYTSNIIALESITNA